LPSIASLPELIAQTNMDQQSISRLREEVIKMTLWISKHADSIFTVAYEACTHEYIEKAKGNRE
jgi:mortality factor 4-like protein 1